jgi:hypothetical protein
MYGIDDAPVRTFGPLTQSVCIYLLETIRSAGWRGRRLTLNNPFRSTMSSDQVSRVSAPRTMRSCPNS